MKKKIIELTEEEWIEVIKLVDLVCGSQYEPEKWNKFNGIKTRMLFQLNVNRLEK